MLAAERHRRERRPDGQIAPAVEELCDDALEGWSIPLT